MTPKANQGLGPMIPWTWPEWADRVFTAWWADYVGTVNGMHAMWRLRWLP